MKNKSDDYMNRAIICDFFAILLFVMAGFGYDWRIGFILLGVGLFMYALTCQKAAVMAKIDEKVNEQNNGH